MLPWHMSIQLVQRYQLGEVGHSTEVELLAVGEGGILQVSVKPVSTEKVYFWFSTQKQSFFFFFFLKQPSVCADPSCTQAAQLN